MGTSQGIGRLVASCVLRDPKLHRGRQNQHQPPTGRNGYITRAVWGVPNALVQGKESAMALKWADWQYDPCCVGGSTTLHHGGLNEPWPISAHVDYIPLAV